MKQHHVDYKLNMAFNSLVPFIERAMKPETVIHLSGAVVAATASLAFVLGLKVGSNDAKLFQAYDKHRIAMLERSCGSTGQLFQDSRTQGYACAYINRDGSMVFRDVSDTPFLTANR